MLTISRVYVVDAASASPQLPGVTYYGIEATHSGMAKFDGENAPGYRNVSTAIRQWVAESTSVIKLRWEVEEEDRRLRASLESYERIRAYVSVVHFSNFRGTDTNSESPHFHRDAQPRAWRLPNSAQIG